MTNLNGYRDYLIANGHGTDYVGIVKRFLDYLGERELSQKIITDYFNEKDYKPETKNLVIKSGRSYQAFLGNPNSLWHGMKYIKVDVVNHKSILEEDIGKCVYYLNTYHGLIQTKMYAILNFMFYSLVRKSELLQLTREDFDLEKNIAIVRRGKGGKPRVVHYPPRVGKMIKKYFEEFLVTTEKNAFGLENNYSIDQIFKLLKANYPFMTPHTFRRSGAKYLLKHGMVISEVSELLGHTSLKSTLAYVRFDDDEITKSYNEKIK